MTLAKNTTVMSYRLIKKFVVNDPQRKQIDLGTTQTRMGGDSKDDKGTFSGSLILPEGRLREGPVALIL